MKNKFLILMVVICALPLIIRAQDNKGDFGIKFSGFVKNDFFYDTRQTVNIREGHFLLYPSAVNLDANDVDINAKPSFNFLSIQSRITGKISAPDVGKAKTSGVIEADFFGNENAAFVDVNGFRLRHAYAKLTWAKTELLFGQYWHPLFIPECFSGVISFNTGAPVQPFSRNPQIRAIHKFGKINVMAALNSQRDFTSPGGSVVLRNSGIPEANAQVYFSNKNTEAKKEFLAGIGGGYKSLKPALFTEKNGNKYSTDELVSSIHATAYMKIKMPKYGVKFQGVYGQNLFDLIMLGGYGIYGITDTATNAVAYTTINTGSAWLEFETYGDKVQFGLWGGYTQNMGSSDTLTAFGGTMRGSDIHHLYRVSPRVVFVREKMNFAVEAEYTTAAYATRDDLGVINRDNNGVITEYEDVNNIRLLLSVIYKF